MKKSVLKNVIKEVTCELINESSLSRIYNQSQKHDFGVITAYRDARDCGTGEPYSKADNQKRNKSLLAKLRAGRYSVTSVRGSYIENYGTPNAVELTENSFVVVDIKDKGDLLKTLKALGEEFDQDCILFGNAGEAGTLYGTNKCPDAYPGYGKTALQGKALFGKSGEFMTKVNGRPFVFNLSESITQHPVAGKPTELRGPVALSKLTWQDLEID